MKQTVVHTINLDKIGGVQQMFVPYYQLARQRSKFIHKVFGLLDIDKQYADVDVYKSIKKSFFHKCEYIYHLL